MATLTIRNVPEEIVARVKTSAAQHGHSMEQELRSLIERRYRSREDVLRQIEARWKDLPKASPEEIERWIGEGRE
jgi:plasmid stability protein